MTTSTSQTLNILNMIKLINVQRVSDMELITYRRLQKIGYSTYVNIPSKFLKELNLKENEYVEVSLSGDKIEIRKLGGEACDGGHATD